MKKLIKKIILFCIVLIIIFSNSVVKAAGTESVTGTTKGSSTSSSTDDEENDLWSMKEIIEGADDFIDNGREETESKDIVNEAVFNKTNSVIYNMLFGIGVVLAVIIGGVLGIKFMVSSAEDKADIKNAMIPYIIGCIVIFGAFTIWKIVVNLLQSTI